MKVNEVPSIIDIAGGSQSSADKLASLLDSGTGHSRMLTRLYQSVAVLTLLFLLWSMIAEVEELARARGEVKPVSRVQQLQTEEGGILAELLVEPNQYVEAGDVIARFFSTNIEKDTSQVALRQAALKISLERWGAIADGREPDFTPFEQYPRLVDENRKLYNNQLQLNKALVDGKLASVNQINTQIKGLQAELPQAQQELDSLRDVLARDRKGAEKGLISAVQVSEAQQRVSASERTLTSLQSQLASAKDSLNEAEAELEQARDQLIQDARSERSDLIEKIDELDAELQALQTRKGRREVIAPVAGFVQKLPETQVGAVLQPGGLVAEVVPVDGGVIMEVMLAPRDIGFVRVGQQAVVKVDAFDYSRFGSVAGEVKSISPTSFKNERDGSAFYKVYISMKEPYVGGNKARRLLPGMTGEVDIVTGEKTVFQYLAKPVFTGMDTAFSER
ncbi:HlyD family type I secretion periplasmic adaptor subunit [Aestuariicella sp. G3-2]|uniref:HlyD family type I secretion periplasmic adaptor subunit n=1 Tax=Pseudomaricurvus albidus TaxID=2842452 RepID=UPI001C0E57A4|nr:HlyD family type I secretion periplasmic adaptor subunit [Aestuariicella albida]MBU3071102.1 HlyD family type I secretion periplasmic adaptor subunit [Aestuariicella albida]